MVSQSSSHSFCSNSWAFLKISLSSSSVCVNLVTTRTKQTNEEVREIFKKAHDLEQKEWEEIWETIKKGNKSPVDARGWWD